MSQTGGPRWKNNICQSSAYEGGWWCSGVEDIVTQTRVTRYRYIDIIIKLCYNIREVINYSYSNETKRKLLKNKNDINILCDEVL